MARIKALRQKINEENARHSKERKRLDSVLAELRKQCPHSETQYHPDPSGNNDSSYECHICGKEARRL